MPSTVKSRLKSWAGGENRQPRDIMAGGSTKLYGNLVGLGAALATFAVLVISYILFMKKISIPSSYFAVFLIVNVCLLMFLVTFIVYFQTNSVFAN
jgi:hypothetical protein